MYVLVTYKIEDDHMKNEGARVIILYSYILDGQGQLTLWLVVECSRKSLIQAFMIVLVTCKNEEDPIRK